MALISNVFRFFHSENTAKFCQFPEASREWLDHVITGAYVGHQQPAHEIPQSPTGSSDRPQKQKREHEHTGLLATYLHPSSTSVCLFLYCSEMDFSWKMLPGTRKRLKPCIFSNIPIFQMKKMRSIERK